MNSAFDFLVNNNFFSALFGEGPPERRDRLRKLLSELGKSQNDNDDDICYHHMYVIYQHFVVFKISGF